MTRTSIAAACIALAILASGSAPPPKDLWKAPREPHSDDPPDNLPRALRLPGARHWHYMLRGVPDGYLDQRSDVPRTRETIRQGGVLYAAHCAACHGAAGFGVRDPSQSLLPSPALLAFLVQKPIAVDEYLLWSIAEGGTPFDSAMPAFKDRLTRAEIWKIIAFMRAGFPAP